VHFKSIFELESIQMVAPANFLPVGELTTRGGVATSALRYYESEGLIHSWRT